MPLKLLAIIEPPAELISRISDLAPENPFFTNEYVRVRQRLGSKPCAIVLDDGGMIVAGCVAFLSEGRVNSRLEITSLPMIPDKEVFWQGLFDRCRELRISVLNVNTFASTEPVIGEVDRRISHKRRSEYRLDLTVPDLWEIMNRRNRRHVKKARSAGLILKRTAVHADRDRHVELANLSLDRLRRRGESIDYRIEIDDINAFIDCDAGELFQAVLGEEIYSSILIARSRSGAYAQSSGTSDAGRELGSSHFIYHEVACTLKSEDIKVFNIGGVDEHNTGLQEFKLGLGAVRIELESADFYTGSAWKRLATRAAGLLKRRSL